MAGVQLRAVHLLALAYLVGVAGSLWDWHEHLIGAANQFPHVVIDVGGLLAIGVLAFSEWKEVSNRTLVALYALLIIVVLLAFGPFVLMMAAPHSAFMRLFMSWAMTRGALSIEVPIVVLAGFAAWRWVRLAPVTAWRVAAAAGVVVVAVASVWDLYWHQTHPLEMGASMNMMTLPPHQLILAGFVLGLVGSSIGAVLATGSGRRATAES